MRRGSAIALTLLVAGSLAALLGTLATPLMGRASGDLERTTRGIAAGLRYTRSRAVDNKRPEAFVLDTRKHAFEIPEASNVHKLPEAVDVVFFSTREHRVPRADGVIRFFPDGSSTGGRLELSAQGARYLVNVDWLTGKVDVIESVVDEARGR